MLLTLLCCSKVQALEIRLFPKDLGDAELLIINLKKGGKY